MNVESLPKGTAWQIVSENGHGSKQRSGKRVKYYEREWEVCPCGGNQRFN